MERTEGGDLKLVFNSSKGRKEGESAVNIDLGALIKLDDQEIIDVIGMADLPLITYILYKKYSGKVELIDIGNDCAIRFGEQNIANMSYLAAYIHFIEIKGNVLTITGNISLPDCFEEKCVFYPMVNGQRQECYFFDANLDLKLDDGIRYEIRTAFEITIDMEAPQYKDKKIEVVFVFETNGIKSICGKINSMRFAPTADCLKGQYAVRSGRSLEIKGHTLVCSPCDDQQRSMLENNFRQNIEILLNDKAENIIRIREEYFERLRKKKKPIWLFFDRIDKADDNGEALFRYVCSLNIREIDCYFVISKKSPDFDRLSAIGNVIDALSFEHKVMFSLADYIITSQLNGYVENPYGDNEEYFRDIYHLPKVVFLQHGVTKDDQTKWLNRFYNNLHSIVVSAKNEKLSFLEYNYFYKPEKIWLTGMPRYDLLSYEKDKCILFMPTWRNKYMEQLYDESTDVYKWYPKSSFRKSAYYTEYNAVLNDINLYQWCKRLGYRIIFMPHPIMQPYIEEFDLPEYIVRLPYNTPWRELFRKSALMITDYSSVAFDFAYTKKPLIYFQFDKEDFFRNHSYKEGYFDYKKMGFGEIVYTRERLIKLIIKYMLTGCKASHKYIKRVDDFFAYNDNNNCQRVLDKIMSEVDC